MGKRSMEELRKAAEAMGLRPGRTVEAKVILENGMESIKSANRRNGAGSKVRLRGV